MLSNFKNNFNGGTRQNRFRITGSFPTGGGFTDFHIRATTIPNSTLKTVTYDYFGRKYHYPGEREYGTWSFSAWDDIGAKNIWGQLQKWQDFINQHDSNITTGDPKKYKAYNWKIQHLDLNGDVDPLKEWILHGCWPVGIQPVSFNMGNPNTINSFNVIIVFDYIEITGITNEVVFSLPGLGTHYPSGSSQKPQPAPLPEPTSALDYEVWATSFIGAPPNWNTENYSTFGIVPMPALTANANNGLRSPGTSVSMSYSTFLSTIETIPETRRVASTYVYWDDLVSWTRDKHEYYKNTSDGFTFAGGRFLNPWPDNQYTDCKNHLLAVLNYLDSQNVNIDYFCDDKENVVLLYGLYGYNTGRTTTRPASFDVNGNPIVAFPAYHGCTLDARIIGAVVADPRLQSFVDPDTGKSVGQSVIDNYKIISSQPNYTGTAGTLLTRWAGITHPGDFDTANGDYFKQFSFFGPGPVNTERIDDTYKQAAWYGTLYQFMNGYYATRMFTEAFQEVPRYSGCTYSNYESYPISAEEAWLARDSNDQPFCQPNFSNLSGGKAFYSWSGNIIWNNFGGITYISGYITNPSTDRERYTWCGHNDSPYSGPGNLVRYANNILNPDWGRQASHKQFIDDLKWIRHIHRSNQNFWQKHTPFISVNGVPGSPAMYPNDFRYWYEMVYHNILHGVLYVIQFDYQDSFTAEKMNTALNNWRTISYNSKSRPCSNSTGDINLPVDRLLIGDSIINTAKSGGYLLKTGQYLWRITAPPTATRQDGTIVFNRVGTDSDIPASITVDTSVEGNGCGIWIKRNVSTPPNYVWIPE